MSATKPQILIVDDSPQDIQFLMANLKDDYAVLVATSGEKAIEMLSEENKPQLVLMDVMMPNMNGYEVCSKIKAKESTKNIDVIFVSAHDTTEEKMAGYEAGGSDYVIKPISPSVLLKKVEVAICNQKIRRELVQEKTAAMETAIINLGLSDEQESQLFSIVQKGVDETMANFELGEESDKQLNEVLRNLKILAK